MTCWLYSSWVLRHLIYRKLEISITYNSLNKFRSWNISAPPFSTSIKSDITLYFVQLIFIVVMSLTTPQSILALILVVVMRLPVKIVQVVLCVVAGMSKVNCIATLHGQTHWLSRCHVAVGRASGYSSPGYELFEKVRLFCFLKFCAWILPTCQFPTRFPCSFSGLQVVEWLCIVIWVSVHWMPAAD